MLFLRLFLIAFGLIIDKGNRCFWMDKWWTGGIILERFNVKSCVDRALSIYDACNNFDLFLEHLEDHSTTTREMWDSLRVLKVDSNGQDDHLIWLSSGDGAFPMKSSWNTLKLDYHTFNLSIRIWSSYYTMKISLLLWRIGWNGMAVDTNIQTISIPLASKCNCCELP